MRNKGFIVTVEESLAAEKAARDRFEQTTVAFVSDGEEVTMAEARKIFERYHPGTDWKRPVDSLVLFKDSDKFARAVEFYQGGRACVTANNQPVGFVRVTSLGYSC